MVVPEEKLGLVVLTNGEAGETARAVMWHVVDHFLGVPQTDWIAALQQVKAKREKDAEEAVQKAQAAANKHSNPSLPPEK